MKTNQNLVKKFTSNFRLLSLFLFLTDLFHFIIALNNQMDLNSAIISTSLITSIIILIILLKYILNYTYFQNYIFQVKVIFITCIIALQIELQSSIVEFKNHNLLPILIFTSGQFCGLFLFLGSKEQAQYKLLIIYFSPFLYISFRFTNDVQLIYIQIISQFLFFICITILQTSQINKTEQTCKECSKNYFYKEIFNQASEKIIIFDTQFKKVASNSEFDNTFQNYDLSQFLSAQVFNDSSLPTKQRRKSSQEELEIPQSKNPLIIIHQSEHHQDQIKDKLTVLTNTERKKSQIRFQFNFQSRDYLSRAKIVQWLGDKHIILFINELDMDIEQIEKQQQQEQMIQNAKLSHEIRNPLNAIKAMLECLVEEVSPDINLNYIQPCISTANQLISLLCDLLDMAQIKKQKLTLNIVPFKIKSFTSQIISMFKMQSSQKQNQLMEYIDPDLKIIRSDPNRLRQIIVNLITNAIKFTSNGCIQVQFKKLSEQVIRIVIKDSGKGISEENQKKLFQEFGKIKDNSQNPYGVGLGLQISQQLALQLGQTGILVKSEEKMGSEFYFEIDNYLEDLENISDSDSSENDTIVKNNNFNIFTNINQVKLQDKVDKKQQKQVNNIFMKESKKKENIKSSKRISFKQLLSMASRVDKVSQNQNSSFSQSRIFNIFQNSAQILIVDDSAFNLKAQTLLLEKINIDCETAISGQQAIEKVKQKKQIGQYYKIILMDIEMPEMNGFEAAKEIRKIVREEDSTIIGCTGYSDYKNDIKKTFMEEIITKPVTKSILKKLLKRLQRKEFD